MQTQKNLFETAKNDSPPDTQKKMGGSESNIATPMMTQYLKIKTQNPACLLFYRMGDFYELFFDDAEQAAAILNITLTKRGKYLGKPIPMCGVPVHASEAYLLKLIRAGCRVAVCEQIGTAKPKTGALMKREVVRIITKGTITEDALLEGAHHNYLLAFHKNACAWADISTGEFWVKAVALENMPAEIARLNPQEIILAENSFADLPQALKQQLEEHTLMEIAPAAFDPRAAQKRLNQNFGGAAAASIESLAPNALGAAGALLDYVQITQMTQLGKIQMPIVETANAVMMIDAAARENLELTKALKADHKNTTLAWVMNQTLTSAGARLLAKRICAPLTESAAIHARHDEVQWFLDQPILRAHFRDELKTVPDILRALSRLSYGKNLPRDLGAMRDGLAAIEKTIHVLNDPALSSSQPENIKTSIKTLLSVDMTLRDKLVRALAEELPLHLRDGGIIVPHYDPTLDQQQKNAKENRRKIITLQNDYIVQTKIKSLKIKHNNILGYYIETSAAAGTNLLNAPANKTFIHRQTLANVLRFSTIPLADLASAELQSTAAASDREKYLFETLIASVLDDHAAISAATAAIAQLDVAAGLASLAEKYNYCRPTIDDSCEFNVVQGRHPVVEVVLESDRHDVFIANDCQLHTAKNYIWLLTGPNMAGKSTFLRQNALIAVMAQTGSFVPATRAHIGIIDRLFSRVGAADNLVRGQSTFMVEMVEAATILAQATAKSFVIIDEIGRGTATFDGLALAWAIIEYLHQKTKCRALFATHFHELTQLEDKLTHVSNHHMKTLEAKDQTSIQFMHEVAEGAASRAYGVQVAKLAGLPNSVIARAAQLLARFEKQKGVAGAQDMPDPPVEEIAESEVEKKLAALDLEDLSPRQALDMLYQLKGVLQK